MPVRKMASCASLTSLVAHVLPRVVEAGGYATLLHCISLQRLLWPDHPIDVLMSVGVGVSPAGRRDKGLSSFMETGALGQSMEFEPVGFDCRRPAAAGVSAHFTSAYPSPLSSLALPTCLQAAY